MLNACTIIARNYLAHARVLADSFFAHHPDGVFTVLVIDDEGHRFDAGAEAFQCLRLSDIGLDRAEICRLAALYDVTELATAVKPPLLQHLLKTASSPVVYLDPDIRLYGSLEHVSRLAEQHGIVLTPHMRSSMPRDGRRVDDFHILAAGVYNLGFIAVGTTAGDFLAWWWEKTQREARVDPTRMMFTDQRWVDFAPSFFSHFILKDPSYNVAYWNLHERELTWNGTGYLVDGKPLTFFHFSGFDGRAPHLLSKHQGARPRILLSERPAVARICHEYRGCLDQAKAAQEVTVPYGWLKLPSGLPFDPQMRSVYRESFDKYFEAGGPEPPNPFSDEVRFLEWLNEPIAIGLRSRIPRYLLAIYRARADLQQAFPDLAGSDRQRYLDWIRTDGASQHNIPDALMPPVPSALHDGYTASDQLSDGVNIAGYFQAEVGVGEAARLLTSALDAAAVPYSTLTYEVTPSRKRHEFHERGDRRAPHDVNILCVNADQTARFARDAGPAFFQGRHTVGYWFWELDRFPPAMHHAFDYVDEVWTATRFVASGIQAIGRRPVYTIPLPVPVPPRSASISRSSLGIPEGFLFLFAFDFFSIVERKNPLGLIDAFQRAFAPGSGPVLVVKTINGDKKLTDLEKVRAAAAGREDILIVDRYYSAEQKNALMALCDCYVSLHRSEGLGLTMAEAMALQKPVIATAYSGNLDFMTPENSYLVEYTTGSVPLGCDPYPPGSPWAEPNIDHAAAIMRQVYESKEEAGRRARQAQEDILTKHSPKAAATSLRQRLDRIRETRSRVTLTTASRSSPSASPDGSRSQTTDPIVGSLERAAALLTPQPSAAPARRFRRPLLALQNLFFRILRPYWWQQRELHASLIDAIRLVAADAARASRSEPHQRRALESLWSTVHALESSSSGQLARLNEKTSTLETRLGRSDAAAATFQASASTHLSAVTEQLAVTTTRTDELFNRLYPIPYMQQQDAFRYLGDGGNVVLGFRGRREEEDLYVGFEGIFRGSESMIRDRLRRYVPLLRNHKRVVELGSGRGELLDILREASVTAVGVDSDLGMVRACRAKGHTVEHGDGISYLRRLPDSSQDAIVAIQVVEHVSYDDLISFLQLSHAKLENGGVLIFETVNPHSLEAFKTFWTDLTHQRPIFPEVALAWCWLVGFEEAYVVFPNGTGELEQDRRTQGEYAVVATRRSPVP